MEQLHVLHRTRAYDKFEILNFNRDIGKTKNLEASMIKHGFLPAHPLHVVMTPQGKLRIKAGHHRFYVARKHGYPVYYIISNDNATIFELEEASNPWRLPDYLTANLRTGKTAYRIVKEYHSQTGINLRSCISMLAGHSAGSHNKEKEFKQGSLCLDNPHPHAEIVADIITHCLNNKIPWATNDLFVQAISKVAWVDKFDVKRFKHKIRKYFYLIEKQRNLDATLQIGRAHV